MKMNKKGFTLIEMLVVIAIIAILVAIIVPTVANSTKKASCAANAANIRSVAAEIAILDLTTEGGITIPATGLPTGITAPTMKTVTGFGSGTDWVVTKGSTEYTVTWAGKTAAEWGAQAGSNS